MTMYAKCHFKISTICATLFTKYFLNKVDGPCGAGGGGARPESSMGFSLILLDFFLYVLRYTV